MILKKNKKKFNTKSKQNTSIVLIGKIKLKKDEQITFLEKLFGKTKEYDVVKKSWGYYATPSINKRLKKFHYECALIKNNQNKFFICLVSREMKKQFKLYLKKDEQELVCWINDKNLKKIQNLK